MIIRPAKSIFGEIIMPGDKSISHRSTIIASMADGESRVENFSTGEDCASTVRCLKQLGVRIEADGSAVLVSGVGKTGFKAPTEPLDCGNSGTTMRLLSGVLAGQRFESVLTGDESLRKRPMNRIIDPLRQMGANIVSNDGLPPLTIRPNSLLSGIQYKMTVASAQVKSCLLLAGLNARGETTVHEPIATRDHTERMLRGFGVDVRVGNDGPRGDLTVSGDSELFGRSMLVPGDISAAAFFLVAAACLDGSDLTLNHLGLNPTRSAILEILHLCGIRMARTYEMESLGEPFGTVRVPSESFSNIESTMIIGGRQTAELIDELPILSVLGTRLPYGLEVRDAAELRFKETDRITAVVENLKRMNADVEEFDDGFRVGRSNLEGAEVDSFGDHRIAMAFAIAGLWAKGETTIKNAECVEISFPGFFETLDSVVKR